MDAAATMQAVGPLVDQISQIMRSQNSALQLANGVFLSFCGGSCMISLAVLEAVRSAGMEKLINNFKAIMYYSDVAVQGVHSGNEDEAKEAGTRLFNSFLAAVAAVRSHLARSVVFGCALGESAGDMLMFHGQSVLHQLVPAEYHSALPKILKNTMKVVGMALAWRFQRLISAVQCAIRGSDAIRMSLYTLSRKQAITAPPTQQEQQSRSQALPQTQQELAAASQQLPGMAPFRIIGYTVMGCGLAYQIVRGFEAPGFLLSLNLVESALTQMLMAL